MGVFSKIVAVVAPFALLEGATAACSTSGTTMLCTGISTYPTIPSPGTITVFSILDSASFEDLPDSISELTALQDLTIEDTALEAIPSSISALTSLTKIAVSNNAISYMPESFGSLAALQTIEIDDNMITVLQLSTAMTALTSVSAANNEIAKIPSAIEMLTTLTYLNLSGNPLCGNTSVTDGIATVVLPDEVSECSDGLSMAIIIAIPLAFGLLGALCLACLCYHKYHGAGKNRTGNSAGQHQLW